MASNFQCVWMKRILFHYFHSRTFWMSRFDFWLILFNLSPVAPHIFHPVIYCILIILTSQHIPFTFHNTPKTLILCIIQQCKRAYREVTIHFCPKSAIFFCVWYCRKQMLAKSLKWVAWYLVGDDLFQKIPLLLEIGNKSGNILFSKPPQIINVKDC